LLLFCLWVGPALGLHDFENAMLSLVETWDPVDRTIKPLNAEASPSRGQINIACPHGMVPTGTGFEFGTAVPKLCHLWIAGAANSLLARVLGKEPDIL
jgi:hypothetical protein